MKLTPEYINKLEANEIFVFGSNLAGIHGGGAAFTAKKLFGAELGVGIGLTGKCYALPTKDKHIETMPIYPYIAREVLNLFFCIKNNPDKVFLITKVGCGLAGYTEEDIAPLFKGFINLPNITLPLEFIEIINRNS